MLLQGHARPPPAPQPAQHPGLRRQVEPPGQLLRLFYCTVLVCSKEISALTDFSESCEEWTFPDSIGPSVGCGEEWICRDHRSLRTTGGSGYLTKLLQNHTAYACDGDHLNLQCPRHSTISVQSAFYGQDYQMCSTQQPASQREDSLTCVAPTTLQKVLDECQNQRACHLLVNSRVFGPDLCPGSSKYLLVSFKCQPNELKNKTVCENQELKLHCHPSKFLNIYSASYGRRTQEPDICFSEAERLPPFDCLSYSALQVLSRRCYGKQRCKIIANNHHFGSPCLPGVQKYLSVTYACGINFDPSETRVLRKDGVIVSNSLAAFAYIRAHPERAALLFVSSVCIGLALTLCALVIRVSCTKDFRELQLVKEHLVPGSDKAEEDSEDEEGEEDSSDSDFPGEPSGFCRTAYPVYSSIEAAELAERIERREQIIQEIWMNSGLDTSLPRNMSQFY
ncbi:protein eva-1 homolog C isoform X2 [Acinonyx jubatus]|uniref:Protein eva-1 homolog C isoform X2 n=1 Tax=Acinonyx jubatus TaxID=32536 RepID=A0ABM3PY53_ACIJB|nr:protein eva-1 homolog C isoform X2 [Acinonyx jubatus]